mmetsp:Transcript_1643/g.10113  ORF Transcript_1643/g.10113 Transcript_1643/m.10113 type:complete len:299 (-) Transcript_1643:986-1882(-)
MWSRNGRPWESGQMNSLYKHSANTRFTPEGFCLISKTICATWKRCLRSASTTSRCTSSTRSSPGKHPLCWRTIESQSTFKKIFFSYLEEERPDYRWLIVGPARSGSSFHQDPNCTNAWNAVIRGTKKWILFPPHITPPGVHPSVDGADVATPVSLVEWFLNFYAESKDLECQPYECICKEGDLLYVPHGWWHLAFNLTDTIAITQNYVNASNLKHVLHFLRSKNPGLISGVEESRRPMLATLFEEKLRESEPHLMRQLDQDEAKRREKSAASKRLASIFTQDNTTVDNPAPAPFRFCF